MPDVATVSSNVRLPQLPQELQHRDSDDEDQSNKGRKQNLRHIDDDCKTAIGSLLKKTEIGCQWFTFLDGSLSQALL